MSKDRPWGKGTPTWTRDATANDSDKSFTVPTGKVWLPQVVVGQIVNTATVGNRVLMVSITDGTNEIFNSEVTANIAASTTGQIFAVWSDITPNANVHRLLGTPASAAGIARTCNMPPMQLPAGYIIRVYDVAAIDAAADDMTVVLHYVEYDA